jgi:hypothetical protein
VTPTTTSAAPRNLGVFWSLRVLESGLLLSALVGLGLFAWSLIDIIRIETAAAPTTELPSTAWPGIFVFFGSLVLLQVVRVVLMRYRHEDGSPRGDARDAAAAATAEVLASVPDESEPAAQAAEVQREG